MFNKYDISPDDNDINKTVIAMLHSDGNEMTLEITEVLADPGAPAPLRRNSGAPAEWGVKGVSS